MWHFYWSEVTWGKTWCSLPACWSCAHSPCWLIFPLLAVRCCRGTQHLPHIWPSGERKEKIIETELQLQSRLSELYGEPSFCTASVSGFVGALTQRRIVVFVNPYLRYGVPLMEKLPVHPWFSSQSQKTCIQVCDALTIPSGKIVQWVTTRPALCSKG